MSARKTKEASVMNFDRVNFGTCPHDGGRLVQFSPSGKLIASAGGFDFKCIVWDVEKQTMHSSDDKSAKSWWFTALAFGPHDQYICSTTMESAILLRDLRDQSAAVSIPSGHTKMINSLMMSDDEQKIMSASTDRHIKIWDLRKTPAPVEKVKMEHEARKAVFGPVESKTLAIALEWNPAATELRVNEFGSLSESKREPRSRIAAGPQTTLELAPSTELVAVATTTNKDRLYPVRVYNTRTRESLLCEGHSYRIAAAQFAAEEKCLITGSYDRSICVWDITGKLLHRTVELEDAVMSLSTIPNSPTIKTAAILANGRVCMFG